MSKKQKPKDIKEILDNYQEDINKLVEEMDETTNKYRIEYAGEWSECMKNIIHMFPTHKRAHYEFHKVRRNLQEKGFNVLFNWSELIIYFNHEKHYYMGEIDKERLYTMKYRMANDKDTFGE